MLLRAPLAALRQAAQPPCEFRRIAQAAQRVAGRGLRDVVAQHFIRHVGFPARRERPAKVSDHQLVQQDAQRVEIRTFGRRLAGQHFRRHVQRSAAGGVDVGDGRRQTQPGHGEAAQAFAIHDRGAAEVRQADSGRRPTVVNQHIGRLEVFVQDAGAMRDGQRLGALRGQLQPLFQRYRGQAATCLRPLIQISAADPFAGDERRQMLELAVQHAHETGRGDIAACDFLQQPADRQFALQGRHGAHVDCKFEYPKPVFAIATQPQIGLPADTERLDQSPFGTIGWMVAGLQVQPRGRRWHRSVETHRHGQPVTQAPDHLNRCCLRFPQRRPKAADGGGQHRLRQDTAGPAALRQLFLAHHFTGAVKQLAQHLQHLLRGFRLDAAYRQPHVAFVEPHVAETPTAGNRRRRGVSHRCLGCCRFGGHV